MIYKSKISIIETYLPKKKTLIKNNNRLLEKTGIELELIRDHKILNRFEHQKRGGLVFVGSQRHVEANNRYVEGYDNSKPGNY